MVRMNWGAGIPVHGVDGQRAVLVASLHLDVALQPVLWVEGVDLDELSPPALVAVRCGVLVVIVVPVPGGLQVRDYMVMALFSFFQVLSGHPQLKGSLGSRQEVHIASGWD